MTNDIIDTIMALGVSILFMAILVHFIQAWRKSREDQQD